MVESCCAPNCKNTRRRKKDRQENEDIIQFYRIPADPDKRRQWLAAIGRKDFNATQYTRLCSKHFISGKF